MREAYWKILYNLMKENPDVYCLVGDLGYGGADKIREDFPDRFINCGASEFAMIGIACGLALEGKRPFCYSITPFLLYRAFEMIRTYVNHEKIPIFLIGSGRGDDYKEDGFSHFAGDDKSFMEQFKNIQSRWPENSTVELETIISEAMKSNWPYYINLSR